MTVSKIAIFAVLLFIFRFANMAVAGALWGAQVVASLIVAQYVIGPVIYICVFAYMSWVYPAKPFLNASIVGVSSYILGVLATVLIVGSVLWDPITLLFDAVEMIVTVLVGAGLGSTIRRRVTAKRTNAYSKPLLPSTHRRKAEVLSDDQPADDKLNHEDGANRNGGFGQVFVGTLVILALFGVGIVAMMITLMMGEGVGTFFGLWLLFGAPVAFSLLTGR